MQQIPLDLALDTAYTLEGYSSKTNDALVQHLRLWLSPSGLFSPVPTYIWGMAGSGKTHLLQAVRHQLQKEGLQVGFLNAQLGQALQAHPLVFNESWSLVIMDDVDSYDSAQQHQAFSWFVQAQSMQIGVLAAGKLPPADLPLREDLRSRLGWGEVFALTAPSDEERRGLLRKMADARGLVFSDEVLDYILSRFSRDMSNLAYLLERLDRYSLQTQRAITIPMLKDMLGAL